MTKSIRELLILLVSLGSLWWFFTLYPPFRFGELEWLDIDKEVALGELILDNLYDEEALTRYEGGRVDSAIHILSDHLLDQLEEPQYDHIFILIEHPEVNAYALPGGNIIIHTGLVEFTENPQELAAVLAHELGHVEMRHISDKLAREFGFKVLLGILTGWDPGILSEVFETVVSSGFEREQESEADEYAFALLERAGIHPKYMADLFERMKDEYGGWDAYLEFISSHPSMNRRISGANNYQTGPDFVAWDPGLDWEVVRSEF